MDARLGRWLSVAVLVLGGLVFSAPAAYAQHGHGGHGRGHGYSHSDGYYGHGSYGHAYSYGHGYTYGHEYGHHGRHVDLGLVVGGYYGPSYDPYGYYPAPPSHGYHDFRDSGPYPHGYRYRGAYRDRGHQRSHGYRH